jgi:hypothetical protein
VKCRKVPGRKKNYALKRKKGFRELHKILWAKEAFLISLAKLRMDDISFLIY